MMVMMIMRRRRRESKRRRRRRPRRKSTKTRTVTLSLCFFRKGQGFLPAMEVEVEAWVAVSSVVDALAQLVAVVVVRSDSEPREG